MSRITLAFVTLAAILAGIAVEIRRAPQNEWRFLPPTGKIWLFESFYSSPQSTRLQFLASSIQARAIANWVELHQDGWARSDIAFKPTQTQIVSDTYAIELLNDSILVEYSKAKGADPDDDILVSRSFSSGDRRFWQSLIAKIKMANQSTDPTLASGTPLAEPESRHP